MFEDALIESSHRRKVSKTALTLPVSLVIHGMTIGVIVGASLWFVDDVPEPSIPVTFYEVAGPPPKMQPDARKGVSTSSEARNRAARRTETQPLSVPDEIPLASASIEPATSGEGEEGLVTAEVGGDRPGGSPDGDSDGTGRAGGGEEPWHVGGDVKAPVLQTRVEPEYPETARRAGIQGVVVLEAVITAGGSVEGLTVLKSVHPLLDGSAMHAVSRWIYKPATLRGRAVRVYLTVTVSFHLH